MNPLFLAERRRVSKTELNEARAKDLADLNLLQMDVEKAFSKYTKDQMTNVINKGVVNWDEVFRWRKAVENFLFRAAEIGGIANRQRDALKKLYASVIGSLREASPPEHESKFDQLTADSEHFQQKWTNSFVRQFTRNDTPILGGEMVSSLLTEDVETVRLVASTLEQSVRRGIYDLAVELVHDAQKDGYTVAQADQKLQALRNST